MSYREYFYADKAELNRERYYKLSDELGVDEFVMYGMKDRKTTSTNDLVYQEIKSENFILTVLGMGGFGKSVFAAQVAEQLHICQKKPLVVKDTKREWYAHKQPMPDYKFSKQLKALGFYPCGLNLEILKPNFAKFDEEATPFELGFRNIIELDEEVALSVFERFMGTLMESSPSYLDMIRWAWQRVNETPDITLETFVNMIAAETDRRRKQGETKADLFKTNARTLKDFNAITPSGRGLLNALRGKRAIALLGKTHIERSLSIIYDAYSAYLDGVIFTLRKQNKFDAACIVEEEFDVGLKHSPDALERLEREVNKLARYGLSKILVTQQPEDVPLDVMRFSHAVTCFNLSSAVDFFDRDDKRAQFVEQTKHLDKSQMSRGVCQIAVFTRTGEKLGECYPFENGGFSNNQRLPQKMLVAK